MESGEKCGGLRMARRVGRRRQQAVMLGMLVVVCALAAVFLYNVWTTHVFCSEIEQLSSEVRNLQYETDALKSAYEDQKNSTKRTIDTRAMVKSIDELSTRLQQTQSAINSLKNFAENTHKGLGSLGEQVNEHLSQPHHLTFDLDSLCSTQREQCTVPSSRQGGYWKSCRTHATALNQAVSIIIVGLMHM